VDVIVFVAGNQSTV